VLIITPNPPKGANNNNNKCPPAGRDSGQTTKIHNAGTEIHREKY